MSTVPQRCIGLDLAECFLEVNFVVRDVDISANVMAFLHS